MKQLCVTGVMIVANALASSFLLAKESAPAALAVDGRSATDAVRSYDVNKWDGGGAKGAPPAWIVASKLSRGSGKPLRRGIPRRNMLMFLNGAIGG